MSELNQALQALEAAKAQVKKAREMEKYELMLSKRKAMAQYRLENKMAKKAAKMTQEEGILLIEAIVRQFNLPRVYGK